MRSETEIFNEKEVKFYRNLENLFELKDHLLFLMDEFHEENEEIEYPFTSGLLELKGVNYTYWRVENACNLLADGTLLSITGEEIKSSASYYDLYEIGFSDVELSHSILQFRQWIERAKAAILGMRELYYNYDSVIETHKRRIRRGVFIVAIISVMWLIFVIALILL